ncbi:MAG: hypothetical protein OXC40_07835 [Proteobacteria bacterium]|nr:hypothetical protein [Pseudomonadota bacterium]
MIHRQKIADIQGGLHVVKKSHLFGTDGIRGPYGKYPIVESLAYVLGQKLYKYFTKPSEQSSGNKKIPGTLLTCRDSRYSSVSLEQALHQGVKDVGGIPVSMSVAPTPACLFELKKMDVLCGVVISASHNPYTDNGFKIFNSDGQKLTDEQENNLARELTEDTSCMSKERNFSQPLVTQAPENYYRYLKEHLDRIIACHSGVKKTVTVVIVSAHGACSQIAKRLFTDSKTFRFHVINASPNGKNINLGVGATSPNSLQTKVKELRADVGIAYDGDGDRILLCSREGEIINGDVLLGLLAIWLHKTGSHDGRRFATTIVANGGLSKVLAARGIKTYHSLVGDRELAELMEKQDVYFGGEPSGHLIFRDHLLCGDGLYATLKILEFTLTSLLHEPSCHWSELIKMVPLRSSHMISKEVLEKVPLSEMKELATILLEVDKGLKQSSPDGEGRVLWRYSGTEKKLRILVEGHQKSEVIQVANMLMAKSLESIAQYCKIVR